jgi:hypothetical protein
MISSLAAKEANDKFQGSLRATYIAVPADGSLLVTAIPANLPTYITVGWNTQYETLFEVTGTSGDNSSNYALTGLTVVKGFGATGNIPQGAALNCLNNEEFFNQYGTAINGVIDDINALQTGVVALTDGATPALDASLGDIFTLSAAGDRTIAVPSNPTDGKKIVIVHYASGGARTLSLNASGFAFGTDVVSLTQTASGKRDLIGCIYSAALNKFLVVSVSKGY